jgi:WD40 repeat protein
MYLPLLHLLLLPLLVAPIDESDTTWLWTVAYHPERATVLATGDTDGLVKLYENDRLTDTIYFGGMVTELDWHPEGELLAVAVQGGSAASIYSVKEKKRTELEGLNEFGVRAIGWNAEGTRLATGDYGGKLNIYDTTGTLLQQHLLKEKGIIGLDWSPDGRTIAAVGDHLTLLDVATGAQEVITDREESVLMLSVAFHPSGEFLVTGDYGDYDYNYGPLLQFWDTKGQLIRRIEKGPGEYRSLEWSHDGNTLAAVSDAVRLYDASGEKLAERKMKDGKLLWGVSWSLEDEFLLVTDDRGKIYSLPNDLSAATKFFGPPLCN